MRQAFPAPGAAQSAGGVVLVEEGPGLGLFDGVGLGDLGLDGGRVARAVGLLHGQLLLYGVGFRHEVFGHGCILPPFAGPTCTGTPRAMASLAADQVSQDEQRLREATTTADDEAEFLAALDETVEALEAEGIPYLLMGGIASACLGRPRWTHDIDLFVKPTDARRVLDALATAGFETEETFPDWLFKASKHGQLIDIIFRSTGDIYVDDEMLERAQLREFMGRRLRIIPPEDLLVIKAGVHGEHTPPHRHHANAQPH